MGTKLLWAKEMTPDGNLNPQEQVKPEMIRILTNL